MFLWDWISSFCCLSVPSCGILFYVPPSVSSAWLLLLSSFPVRTPCAWRAEKHGLSFSCSCGLCWGHGAGLQPKTNNKKIKNKENTQKWEICYRTQIALFVVYGFVLRWMFTILNLSMEMYPLLGLVFLALSYLPLMRFSDSNGPLQIFPWPGFRLLLFGLTFKWESLLKLLWNMKGIEMSLIPGNVLKVKDNRYSDMITRVMQ